MSPTLRAFYCQIIYGPADDIALMIIEPDAIMLDVPELILALTPAIVEGQVSAPESA